jgi:hypothetical protein
MDKGAAANAYEGMKANNSSGSAWSKALEHNNPQTGQMPGQNPVQYQVNQPVQTQPITSQMPGQLSAPVIPPSLYQFLRRPA